MKNSIKIFMTLFMAMVVLNSAGCSKMFGPSDEDVLKAINDSGILKHPGFTATTPVTVLEKGGKRADGAYPVKVKFMVSFTMVKDGVSTPKEMEVQPTFLILKSKDSTGKTVWTAKLGS